jgi:hypothetical protein
MFEESRDITTQRSTRYEAAMLHLRIPHLGCGAQ